MRKHRWRAEVLRTAMTHSDISAYIIAGGRSKRFGQDKALYPYQGRPLIEYAIETAKRAFGRVAIVADRADRFSFPDIPCHPDLVPGLGPIGGVLTALHHSDTDHVFILACDMPELDQGLMVHMGEVSAEYDVTVPWVKGYYEPLHAIYSKNCIAPIEASIKRGQRQIVSFFDLVSVRRVIEEEIRGFVDPSLAFRNINYLHDANAV
jgi:molybdopterin-guanine dinucleotide biosynthesis protein A